MKASGVSLMPCSVAFDLEFVAQLFQIRDVGLIELRDMRQVHPAGMQARAGNLLDARQRLDFHLTEGRKVDHRHAAAGRDRPHARLAGRPRALSACLTKP